MSADIIRQAAAVLCGLARAGETSGLMLGLAGIGHFYLRLHDPSAVTPGGEEGVAAAMDSSRPA